jgi:glycosyltransferase involved in cell wall biosynthesis
MRFHVPGIAHTVAHAAYNSNCAFTGKIIRMCQMLKAAGHTVFMYGSDRDFVICDEHVVCIKAIEQMKAFPAHNWRTDGFPQNWGAEKGNPHNLAMLFNRRVSKAIAKRKRPGDFLLCHFGSHAGIAEHHPDLLVVEAGIGYPGPYFAPFKVFESYSILHAYLGMQNVQYANLNSAWYDVVIPNYYDPDDFTFSAEKDDYLLHFGCREGKGTHIARQIAEATKHELVCVGAGGLPTDRGVVGVSDRRELLSRARAVLAPSLFLEPFCGVQAEAFLSGTPVISTDWGAFTEHNHNDETGYRCRTFKDFCEAVEKVGKLSPKVIYYAHGQQFTMGAVWPRYAKYFDNIVNLTNGSGGWYAGDPRLLDKQFQN